MQDFFSTYTQIEHPTLEMVAFSFVLSFLLSGLVAFTYNKTTQVAIKHFGMVQTLMGGAMVSTMVLQAIGNNIASGLGMLGALTIIQFRTNFKNPRDIVFIFAALGVGITCGLFGFLIAIFGTLLFCVLSFIIKLSPFHFYQLIDWSLKVKSIELIRLSDDFQQVMEDHCEHWSLEKIAPEKIKIPFQETKISELFVYEYNIRFRNKAKKEDFIKSLQVLEVHLVSLSKNEIS